MIDDINACMLMIVYQRSTLHSAEPAVAASNAVNEIVLTAGRQ